MKLVTTAFDIVVFEDTFVVLLAIVPAVNEVADTLFADTPGISVSIFPVHSNVLNCV